MHKDTHKDASASVEKSEVARREEEVLAFWREHDIFKKSIEAPAGDAPVGDFVFYDGPPFATGLPHYGHILAGTIKDAVPRFWTMRGYRVRRKWGWDCHGLPLENLIEKELGLATKKDIEEFGIQNFNEKARHAVMRYADDWREIVPRMGRFVDMDDDYKTMDPAYTESVWWVFKTLHETGRVYEGFKGMHLCPRCGTTLSNFEVNQGYKDIKDIAVTVALPLLDDEGEKTGESLLVWTTTPWTLPGNMAAAVHEDHTYVRVKLDTDAGEEIVLLAKERLEHLAGREYTLLGELPGRELVGQRYEPPFPYHHVRDFEGKENAWKIYHAEYVEIGGEGTGAVHLAPAYGEEDMELAKAEGIPIVHHVGEDGRFRDFVTDFAGQLVKPKDDDDAGVTHLDADIEIVKALKASEKLVKKENITHSYPHCWRCDTPLLNYATTSWFVEVSAFRDQLVKENAKVHWVPEYVGTNRFGKWLEGARDWAVSRQRYWGAPLPIWRDPESGEYTVIGSLSELQEYVPQRGNTFIITRHGESTYNVRGVLNDDPDNTENCLTERGIEQTHAAAETLTASGGVDVIYCSPLYRTQQTATQIAEKLGVPSEKVIVDDRLSEVGFGDFRDRPVDEYHAFFKTGVGRMNTRPSGTGAENWTEVKRRTGDFLLEVNARHQNERILIVSHNGTLQMLQAAAAGTDCKTTAAHIDADDLDLKNAELRDLPFTPYPHNDEYELDYHRPYIDQIDLYNGETKLERVPDVFDCWFESGAMPYAEMHYPFENRDVFEPEEGKRFPADFIAESIDQTRGWFYSMMVLGVGLFGRSPYQNVITNGLVLAEDGRKMSKKLQNYPDPVDLVARQGADSMRFYLLSSSIIKGEDLNFSEKEVQELQRKNIGRVHNVLAMYETYADGTEASTQAVHVLDRWILARRDELVAESTAGYENYELDRATRPITDFIDALSGWYLRRSRDRLKGDDEADKKHALATLRHVLRTLALVIAPPMPFYAEYLWQRVRESGDAESVHLGSWPTEVGADKTLITTMARTREIVTHALDARTAAGIKVRQPLRTLTVKAQEPALDDAYRSLIADEVNVKEVIFSDAITDNVVLDTTLTDELKTEGAVREFMRAVQDMRKRAGLSPGDRITLTVHTSPEAAKALGTYKDELTRTLGAREVVFSETDGEDVSFSGYTAVVSIAS